MKRKKIFALLVGVVIVVSSMITGCSQKKDISDEKTMEQGGSSENQENSSKREIAMMNNTMFGSESACGNKNGFYTIHSSEEGMMNIMYIDYETQKQIYLCDKSQCNHDNDKCTSFIDPKYGGMEKVIVCDDEYLYLITSEYANINGFSTTIYGNFQGEQQDEPTAVYRMNLDGSNKKLLAKLDSGEVLLESFFADDNYIYGVSLKSSTMIIDDNSSCNYSDSSKLIGISKDSGEVKEIAEWNADWSILGIYNNKVIIKQLRFKEELTVEDKVDEEKYMAALMNAEDIIVEFDGNTKEFKELDSNKSSNDYYYHMYGKDIFYYSYNGAEIMNFDLVNKEETVFLDSEYTNIQQIYEDYIIASSWNDEDKSAYLINIKDKSMKDFSLIKNNGLPVNIIAASKDYFFVESNCDLETEYVEWAGVTQEVETNRQYALIAKKDFLMGNKNFKEVKLLVENFN